MRFLAVLLLSLLAAAPLRADDVTELVDRCGKPARDTRSSRDVRHIYYPHVHLVYLRTSDDGWNFNHGEVDGHGTILISKIAEQLPCFDPAPARAAVATTAATVPASDSGEWPLLLIVVGIGAVICFAAWGNARAWKNRPKRLCTNCYTLAQPLQHRDKRWYCGRCGADNPATMDSPLAQAYFARQNANDPVIDRYLK